MVRPKRQHFSSGIYPNFRHSGVNGTKNQACMRNECAGCAIPQRGIRRWRASMEQEQDNDAELVALVAEEFVGKLGTEAVPYLRAREALSAFRVDSLPAEASPHLPYTAAPAPARVL